MTILCSDLGLSSNRLSIGGSNSRNFRGMKSWTYRCRGRRSVWWGWRLTVLAPRILNDVSYVTRINHEIHVLRGRRNIWWSCGVKFVAPRVVNDISYVTRINHEFHFAWQAQYLLRLEGAFACSAQCKWRFIWDADQSWDSFCVAGAVFSEVRGWLLLLRAL